MKNTEQPESLLLIRCPACDQRFKISESLMHRPVECGTCGHHFEIEEDVIVRRKNFRAASHKSPSLGNFQRIEPIGSPEHIHADPVHYGKAPDPSQFEPTPPLRIFAAAIGVFLLLLFMSLLIFGAKRGGVLDGVTTERRLVMASFAALFGSGLILFGNSKSRFKATLFCAGASAFLISLPIVFQDGSQPLKSLSDLSSSENEPENSEQPQGPELEIPLAERIGTDPLVEEIERLRGEGSQKTAVGLWLKKLMPNNRFLVRDFVIRTLGASHETHFYNRGTYEFLLVVTGIDTEFSKIPDLMRPLGDVTHLHTDLSVIEIEVDNTGFVEGPPEKLTNRNDPAFYQLNKRELESIDLKRVEKAVRRLMDTEPKIYHADINRRLVSLLREEGVDFKGEICRAIKRWSLDPKAEGSAALAGLEQLLGKKKKIPTELVELCILSGDSSIIPHLHAFWMTSPHEWESLYMMVGPAAEDRVAKALNDNGVIQQQSALRILEKIGTAASIPALEVCLSSQNPEVALLGKKAIASIQMRAKPEVSSGN